MLASLYKAAGIAPRSGLYQVDFETTLNMTDDEVERMCLSEDFTIEIKSKAGKVLAVVLGKEAQFSGPN